MPTSQSKDRRFPENGFRLTASEININQTYPVPFDFLDPDLPSIHIQAQQPSNIIELAIKGNLDNR